MDIMVIIIVKLFVLVFSSAYDYSVACYRLSAVGKRSNGLDFLSLAYLSKISFAPI
jgi:hypothetical protein